MLARPVEFGFYPEADSGDWALAKDQIERTVKARIPAPTDVAAILSPAHRALSAEARAVAASLSRPPISSVLVSGFVRLIEFIAFVLTGVVVYLLSVDRVDGLDAQYAVPLFSGPLLAVLLIQVSGGYSIAGSADSAEDGVGGEEANEDEVRGIGSGDETPGDIRRGRG